MRPFIGFASADRQFRTLEFDHSFAARPSNRVVRDRDPVRLVQSEQLFLGVPLKE